MTGNTINDAHSKALLEWVWLHNSGDVTWTQASTDGYPLYLYGINGNRIQCGRVTKEIWARVPFRDYDLKLNSSEIVLSITEPDNFQTYAHEDRMQWVTRAHEDLSRKLRQLSNNLLPWEPTQKEKDENTTLVQPYSCHMSLSIPLTISLYLGMVVLRAHEIFHTDLRERNVTIWIKEDTAWIGKQDHLPVRLGAGIANTGTLDTTVETIVTGNGNDAFRSLLMTRYTTMKNNFRDISTPVLRGMVRHCYLEQRKPYQLEPDIDVYNPIASVSFSTTVPHEWALEDWEPTPDLYYRSFHCLTVQEVVNNILNNKFSTSGAMVLIRFLAREGFLARNIANEILITCSAVNETFYGDTQAEAEFVAPWVIWEEGIHHYYINEEASENKLYIRDRP